MSKTIGIDIDAVLTDEGYGEDNIWHRYICEYFDLEKRLNNVYDFRTAYGLSMEEVEEFITQKGIEIFKTVPPRPHSKRILSKFKADGHRIILVTARVPEIEDITLSWLEKHDIPYDEVIHDDQKADVCKEKGIELFIDDRLDNVLSIKKEAKIPVILMNMEHNTDYEGDIKRVDDWLEIEELLLEKLS